MEQLRWHLETLKKEVVSIKLDLPEVKELRAIYDRVLRQQGFDSCDDEERDRVVEAARGLTVMEAQTAFALAGLNNDGKTRQRCYTDDYSSEAFFVTEFRWLARLLRT